MASRRKTHTLGSPRAHPVYSDVIGRSRARPGPPEPCCATSDRDRRAPTGRPPALVWDSRLCGRPFTSRLISVLPETHCSNVPWQIFNLFFFYLFTCNLLQNAIPLGHYFCEPYNTLSTLGSKNSVMQNRATEHHFYKYQR